MSGKYIVRMTVKEREELEKLVRTGKRAVAALLHAWILLKADMGAAEGGWLVSELPKP
jgi:hypothetical protein